MSEITFERNGDPIRAWLATPAPSGPHPALVVIPDVRGIYAHYHDVARRFAGEGFVALVLDLYSREGTPDLPDLDAIFRWMRRLPDRRVLGDVRGAVAYLAARKDVHAVGVTGFCMGGQYTLMAACSVPGIAASVSWYGMLRYAELDDAKPESPLDMARRLACPYLGFFGADDALIPSRDVDELRAQLSTSGKAHEIVVYPGAGHAFFNDTRPDAYRPAAARDSWARAIAFLSRHMGSDPGR